MLGRYSRSATMPLPASLRLSSVTSPMMWSLRASPVLASSSRFHLRSHAALARGARSDSSRVCHVGLPPRIGRPAYAIRLRQRVKRIFAQAVPSPASSPEEHSDSRSSRAGGKTLDAETLDAAMGSPMFSRHNMSGLYTDDGVAVPRLRREEVVQRVAVAHALLVMKVFGVQPCAAPPG